MLHSRTNRQNITKTSNAVIYIARCFFQKRTRVSAALRRKATVLAGSRCSYHLCAYFSSLAHRIRITAISTITTSPLTMTWEFGQSMAGLESFVTA